MPVLTSAGSDSDISHLSGHLHGDRSLATRFNTFLGAATAVVAVSVLFRRFASLWLSRRHRQHSVGGSLRTWLSTFKPLPNSQPLPDRCCMRPGKGPGHSEKQASWAISRGEASGTAPVGLGGSVVERSSPGSMEEEGRTTLSSGERSRGLSTFLSLGTSQASSGLSHPGQVFPAAAAADDGGHDGRIYPGSHSPSPLGHAGDATGGSSFEKGKDNMDDDHAGRDSELESIVATSRPTTPFFGQPENITDHASGSVAVTGGGPSWRRHVEPNFTVPPLPPTLADENPVYLAHGTSFETRRLPTAYAQSVPTGLGIVGAGITGMVDGQRSEPRYTTAETPPDSGTSGSTSIGSPSTDISRSRSLTRGHSIPPMTVMDIRMPLEVDGQANDTRRGARFSPDHALTPSSYPPTSPLLPPPPPTVDYHFDLANIMFPGAGAVDGGIRVVPAEEFHDHGEDGPIDARDEAVDVMDDSVAGWKRHTRVYGGGVCLACAAAGGGGFYGARVRPEDKR